MIEVDIVDQKFLCYLRYDMLAIIVLSVLIMFLFWLSRNIKQHEKSLKQSRSELESQIANERSERIPHLREALSPQKRKEIADILGDNQIAWSDMKKLASLIYDDPMAHQVRRDLDGDGRKRRKAALTVTQDAKDLLRR